MLRRKLILRFIKQIMIAGLLLVGLAITILIWMLNELIHIDINRNFSPSGISKLISEAEIDEQGNIISSELLKQLEADGGWLQSLDEHGNVIQSFYTPDDVPAKYHPSELIDYWLGKKPFPYSLGLWIQVRGEHTFTMLYGRRTTAEQSLTPIIEDAHFVEDSIHFSDKITSELSHKNSWVQVFDIAGNEVASWNKPAEAASYYSLNDLALRNKYYAHSGIAIDSEFDQQTELTWVIQYPIDDVTYSPNLLPNMQPEMKILLISALLFLASSMIVFIILAIWYAHRFMKPIMEVVGSIQQLGKGETLEPVINKKGKHSKKKLFSEVFDSIDSVAHSLQASKAAEKQTQAYREEWIAGVTHDMKTPLASIQGYAHMLATDKYQWTEADVRGFAAIMLEKSQYMNQLLEDLSLTYRLRSGNLPVTLTKQNIGVLLYDAVNLTQQHPLFSNTKINVVLPPNEDVYGEVYHPWFERIVYNLVANSILHNPEHTTVTIELAMLQEQGWQISFKDNGKGMEQHMIEQLFERYYRGTSTDTDMEGSGLGMAITKELVQAMGGAITIDSELGQGTIITLSWKK